MTLHDRLSWPFLPKGNHFGQGVSPEHLRIYNDGTVQVSLTGKWPKLVQHMAFLGEVVATTNNPAASLTQIGSYPHFKTCPCGQSACNFSCGLAFNFTAWHRVWATRRKCDDGIWRTLTISDHADAANHQVLLPAQTDDDQFVELVRKFTPTTRFDNIISRRWQWPLDVSRDLQPPFHIERLRRRKHEFVEKPESGSRAIHLESLAEVWRNILSERLWLWTAVVTAPVVHSTLWQPLSLTENFGTLAVSSNNVSLRCQREQIAELWAAPLSSEANSPLALEAYDRHDDLLFALAAPLEWKGIWSELLHWLPTV